MAKVYVIIVTYNAEPWLDRCLSSLRESSNELKTIVVDNGSSDNTVNHITAHYPEVELHQSGTNLGFGQGNNLGIKIALEQGAEHVFLLNQDAWIKPDTLSKLIDCQQSNPEFGILSPLHLNAEESAMDRGFFTYLFDFADARSILTKVFKKTPDSDLFETQFVNAALWLMSRECLLKVGGFDPIFEHYGEDNNLLQRIRYHGFKLGVLTSAIGVHDREGRQSTSPADYGKRKRELKTQFLIAMADVNLSGDAVKRMEKTSNRRAIRSMGKLLMSGDFRSIKLYIGHLSRIGTLKKAAQRSRRSNRESKAHFLE